MRTAAHILFWPILGILASSLAAANPKTIIDLQPLRQVSSAAVKNGKGEESSVTMINLNPAVNTWYLLEVDRHSGKPDFYHLQNADRRAGKFSLKREKPGSLLIERTSDKFSCSLWENGSSTNLEEARKSGVPYAPLCGRKLYLRNPTKGHQSPIEQVTDILRKEVPGGQEIVTFVRDTFFAYLYERKAEEKVESKPTEIIPPVLKQGPALALLRQAQADRVVRPVDLAIQVESSSSNWMAAGAWYPVKSNEGIYVSVIVPSGITPEILSSFPDRVNPLNKVESEQLVYLIAFDLGRFDLHYSLGTAHPGVEWSHHIPAQMKDSSLPGPDGIGTTAPLVRTGLINPIDAPRTVATFTGGFKRYHGAFKYGPLSLKNHGSHYGFLSNGVLFSTLQPGLSTLFVLNDGTTHMRTWGEGDAKLLPTMRYARQNGVPIIAEQDKTSGTSVPGPYVNRWGPGNWSGSADEKLQTMRAGAGLQESGGRQYLIYAFFWSATPSAMARVFQAYQCSHAMLLDMNALVHTYLAIYRMQGSNLYVQHLIRGMNNIDMTVKGRYVPRFIGYPDDRDFFYLTRKEAP